MTVYAELQVTSNYSFLRGASHPEELVLAAQALGHTAVGIADRNTLAGVARAHVAAEKVGIKLAVGSRLVLEDGPDILCYPTDRAAYGRLARLLTLGKRRAGKGQCRLALADLTDSTVFAGGAGQKLLARRAQKEDWKRHLSHCQQSLSWRRLSPPDRSGNAGRASPHAAGRGQRRAYAHPSPPGAG